MKERIRVEQEYAKSLRYAGFSGFYPNFFLHLVNGFKTSIFYWVFKLNLLKSLQVFSLCLSRKTLDRFFILLHHCFCSYKLQIQTSQTGLTIRFVTPRKNLCTCVQRINNKHDGGTDVGFFLFPCVLLIA